MIRPAKNRGKKTVFSGASLSAFSLRRLPLCRYFIVLRVPEQPVTFDGLDNGRRDELLPGVAAGLDGIENFSSADAYELGIKLANALNKPVLQEVCIKVLQMRCYGVIVSGYQFGRFGLPVRINVKARGIFEELAETA